MAEALAVSVKDLTVMFDDFTAVDRISFDVRQGEIFGFLGANGAGKTTTIRILCGVLLPTSGSAKVAGFEVAHDAMRVKSTVGYMSQKFTLYDDLSIGENLEFAAALRKLDKVYFEQRRKELFEFIELNKDVKTRVKDLPPGVLQQVALVAAILHDPQIIFLDEPTAGVTPVYRELFWKLIRRLAQSGKTVFVTTHYMDEAEQCERIALMRAGKIIAIGSPNDLKQRTFTEPVIELTPPEEAPPQWLDMLRKQDFVGSVNPYGMRYHVRVSDISKWEQYLATLVGFEARRIAPSLEDVFIRLVEGQDR